MKVYFEKIENDKNSSFRTLHINVPTTELKWEYHFHPEVELVCVVSGSGSRHVGYHKGNFWDGDLVLIGSNVPHAGFGLNSTDPHEEIVIQFKEEMVSFMDYTTEFRHVFKMIKSAKLGILFSEEIKQEILPTLFKMLEAEGPEKYVLLLETLSILAGQDQFDYLNKEVMPHSIILKNRERLQNIFTLVEKNYHTEIDIRDVAAIANLTVPAFCNFFKKTTLLTFTEFVNRYRVEKACQHMILEKSISESCYLVGFNNVPYFNRMFKKYLGKSPSEFRNEYK